jgi:hypothetical protein
MGKKQQKKWCCKDQSYTVHHLLLLVCLSPFTSQMFANKGTLKIVIYDESDQNVEPRQVPNLPGRRSNATQKNDLLASFSAAKKPKMDMDQGI